MVGFLYLIVKNVYMLSEGDWNSLFSVSSIVVIVYMLVMVALMIKIMTCLNDRGTMMYDMLESKEFAWDAASNEFTYKDKNRTLRFSGNKVKKWGVISAKKITIDILQLDNGEQIVLEPEFNPDIHPFLAENSLMLHLPECSSLSFWKQLSLNYYKDSI